MEWIIIFIAYIVSVLLCRYVVKAYGVLDEEEEIVCGAAFLLCILPVANLLLAIILLVIVNGSRIVDKFFNIKR